MQNGSYKKCGRKRRGDLRKEERIEIHANLAKKLTRMHSSRMRTARLLPVSPSMHCSPGVVPAWGVYLPVGVYQPRGCTCPEWVYLPRGMYLPGGLYLPRGVYLPGGVYLCGDVPARGVYLPRGYLPRYSPPVNRILDTCYLKYYLAPNFICRW